MNTSKHRRLCTNQILLAKSSTHRQIRETFTSFSEEHAQNMAHFRVYFLYGKYHQVKIDENPVTLETFRRTIENVLPPLREINDYMCVVSGKPPHKLDLNNEEQFNEHRTLITSGCYIWMKLK